MPSVWNENVSFIHRLGFVKQAEYQLLGFGFLGGTHMIKKASLVFCNMGLSDIMNQGPRDRRNNCWPFVGKICQQHHKNVLF